MFQENFYEDRQQFWLLVSGRQQPPHHRTNPSQKAEGQP
jgi:hypothetical protein